MSGVYMPPSLRHFAPRRLIPGPISQLVALEYDLVEAVRPSLVVDAGAGEAVSFYTYCQCMHEHDIDGAAYAIDDWTSDPGHPEAAFEAIAAHGRKYYPGIHYIMRTPPEPAHFHFGVATIDLLRLDGARFTDSSALTEWLARVKPGGLVLCAGAARDPTRAVWERVAALGRSCVFAGGASIGVCLVDGGDRDEMPDLLRLALVEGQLPALESFYAHAREHFQLRQIVGKVGGI